jgi:ABC-type multidrug transport system ATPase subunit
MRLQVDQPDGQKRIVAVAGESVRLGRDTACEVATDPVAFPKVSGIHARIESTPRGFVLVHLSQSNKTLLNNNSVENSSPVKAGDWIRLGFTGPMIEILEIGASQEPPVRAPSFNATVLADSRQMAMLRGSARTQRFELGKGGVIGRDAKVANYQLDHPHVSTHHASLALSGDRVVLADLGSSNGTYVNGARLSRPTALKPGDRIDIGPFALQFDGSALISRSRSNNIELVARGLKRQVQDRTTGQPLRLLDRISLVVRPREFVCLLGPSGSGKSTLLAILSGRNAPDVGTVSLNGEDLYANFEALKEDIAVVPQKDVLHDTLALASALRYTAELRLPSDISREEVETSVSDILEVVGLTKRREMLIRHLSGGQVKRASLANELVARPSLLFLDEVTSGLDEQTDLEVMELFRQVADGGKTVVCITHNLANVEATCHLVVILTEGGRLAFIGTPDEAKAYFQIARLGAVYRRLAEEKPEAWHDRFRASHYFQHYVVERMPGDTSVEEVTKAPALPSTRGARSLRQTKVLTRRYVSIWRGDRQALLAMLGQSVLVAVLLGLVFGDPGKASGPFEEAQRSMNLLLLLAVSCLWFGCNTAAKELVKERVIFLRERDFNLRVSAYFASKFLVLAVIGVAQATLLFAIVRIWCAPEGAFALQWATLAALAVAGTSIGLLISAVARSEEVAIALVPIAVIPQIILANVIAHLNGVALLIAQVLVAVFWGQKALERLLPEATLRILGRETGDWLAPGAIVLAHAAVGAVATVIVLGRSKVRTR